MTHFTFKRFIQITAFALQVQRGHSGSFRRYNIPQLKKDILEVSIQYFIFLRSTRSAFITGKSRVCTFCCFNVFDALFLKEQMWTLKNQKWEGRICQGEKCIWSNWKNGRNGEVSFPAERLIRDHFPNFWLFLTIHLFIVSKFVLFFTRWIHFIPTVKRFSEQIAAVEQLKRKSERGWLGDLCNRFKRRWKKSQKMGCGNTDWG